MANIFAPVCLAVITGGHAFDVPNFHRMFRRIRGVDAYVQTMVDFCEAPQTTRDGYDAILFYQMLQETPAPDSPIRPAIERLRESGQGIVAMHHSLLAYPGWPTWRELTGIDPAWKSYRHDQNLHMELADSSHPITRGFKNFDLVDETYQMGEPDTGNHILMTSDQPHSVRAQAWVRHFGAARVFSLVLGHDNQAWGNPGFAQMLSRGIGWAVRRLA
jgi:uncharacterized protein